MSSLLPKSVMLTAAVLALSSAATFVNGLPNPVPLQLHKGFWQGNFTVGSNQTFSLTVDTGSFAILVKKGLYKPSSTSQQTNISEFIQFSGASQDGTGPAEETVFFVRDDVTFGGVTVHDFLVGNITQRDDLPGDGVAGFSPPASDNDDFSSGQGIIETFCAEGKLSPCEFGIVLQTDGKGAVTFGPMDKTKVKGNITVLPAMSHDSWQILNSTEADSPILVVDGKPFSHIMPTFDSGGPNVIGPLGQVRDLLTSVGYNITEQTIDDITVALGTYDCARKPARVGFSFPPSGEVHYIGLEANVLNRTADGRICTANILGTSTRDGSPLWAISQTWFQGRYVQHDLDNNTLSFADLA